MNASTKFLDLLGRLKEATLKGKVEWHETSDEEAFRTNLGGSMIRVGWRTDDHYEGPIYFATFLTGKAKVVDVIESSGGQDYELLENLFNIARRSARNADELLNSALSFIDTQLNVS